MLHRRTWLVCLLAALALRLPEPPAQAHPMGNFAICHYSRLEAKPDGLRLLYLLDMAEIPTVTEKAALDGNGDGMIGEGERAAYLADRETALLRGLRLTINGHPAALLPVNCSLALRPGAAGLETLKIVIEARADWPPAARRCRVAYRDTNYAARTGWKEILAVGGQGMALRNSTVDGVDRSRALSVYPPDLVPPQQTEAQFEAAVTGAGGGGPLRVERSLAAVTGGGAGLTPRDAFTQLIGRRALTPGMMLVGLGIALLFGAFHALSPGHGKAMVAAYLVGSRGTARHAVLLGLTVTITHTAGVFALGLVTLFASRYIVPERLYAVLNLLSGLAVLGIGGWLFVRRLRGLADGHTHRHEHPHEHPHEHDHAHADGPTHSHDHTHSLPEGPITLRGLIALGISGGMVPCPSALVVLLSAAALGRLGYGMLLITAFSMGLAGVLIGFGLLAVCATRLFQRLPVNGPLLRRLPVAGAALITLIGVVLVARGLSGIGGG